MNLHIWDCPIFIDCCCNSFRQLLHIYKHNKEHFFEHDVNITFRISQGLLKCIVNLAYNEFDKFLFYDI